jgi:hypothetical protein
MSEVLTLTKRPCKIGANLNGRGEFNGNEQKKAGDIALDGLMLDGAEVDALLGQKGAHKSLFDKQDHPILRECEPLQLKQKFTGATLTLTIGGLNPQELVLEDCGLARLVLEPMAGGLTKLSLQAQTHPNSTQAALLWDMLHNDGDAEIVFGSKAAEKAKRKQRELAINNSPSDSAAGASTH